MTTDEQLRSDLIAKAEAAHRNFPQYKNFWKDFVLARVTKKIRTKGGVSFAADEIVIADKVPTTIPSFDSATGRMKDVPVISAYSVRTGMNTVLEPNLVVFL